MAMAAGIQGTGNHLLSVSEDVIALPCPGTHSGCCNLGVLTEWSGAQAVNVVITKRITVVHQAIARKEGHNSALQWEVSASRTVNNVLSKERKP